MRHLAPASITGAVVSLCLLLSCALCQTDHTQLPQYYAELEDDGKFIFTWIPEKDHMTMEIQVATQGYAGLGFSPAGGMRGADIILGWVDDEGTAHLHDMHGVRNGAPLLDDSQDVVLLSGRRNDTHTTLRFRRPWVTCDQHHDMALSGDTVQLIYAYDQEKPVDLENLKDHDFRGVRSIYLQDQMKKPELSEDVKYWDIRSPDLKIPANQTTVYWCRIYKLPDTDRKHHLIGTSPLIDPANKAYPHHMILYECHSDNSEQLFERYVDLPGTRCYTGAIPLSWQKCGRLVAGWAVGSEGEQLPPHVGRPLGEKWGGATYFMLEIHYDNPNKVEGIVENSGLRLYYTSKLREFDASILQIGHTISPDQIIPPLNPNWLSVGHCSSACTQATLPATGIKAIGGGLHTHLLGQGVEVKHIRNGEELPPLLLDTKYDFNYQQWRHLKEERTILPGDHLTVICSYNSEKRIGPSFGGAGTEDEMCLAFIFVYPATALSKCSSQPLFHDVLRSVGVNSIYKDPIKFKRGLPVRSYPPGTTQEEKDRMVAEQEAKLYEALKQDGFKALSAVSRHYYDRWKFVEIKEPEDLQNMTVYDHLTDNNLWQGGATQERLQSLLFEGRYLQSLCDDVADIPLATFPPLPPLKYVPYLAPAPPCTPTDSLAAASPAPQPQGP